MARAHNTVAKQRKDARQLWTASQSTTARTGDDLIPNTTGPTLCGLHHPSSADIINSGGSCRRRIMQGGTAGPRPPMRVGIQAETMNPVRVLLRQPGSPPQLSLSPSAVAVRVNRERPVVGPGEPCNSTIARGQGTRAEGGGGA